MSAWNETRSKLVRAQVVTTDAAKGKNLQSLYPQVSVVALEGWTSMDLET